MYNDQEYVKYLKDNCGIDVINKSISNEILAKFGGLDRD